MLSRLVLPAAPLALPRASCLTAGDRAWSWSWRSTPGCH